MYSKRGTSSYHYHAAIKSAENVDPDFYEGLKKLFDDCVTNDMDTIADDDMQYNQLADAVDNLFESVCKYLDIPDEI